MFPENAGRRSNEEGPGAEFVCTVVFGQVETTEFSSSNEVPPANGAPAEVPAGFRVLVVEDTIPSTRLSPASCLCVSARGF